MSDYDPFSNNPQLSSFFYKETQDHLHAMNRFSDWLRKAHPDAYTSVMNTKPELLDSVKMVSSGAMGVKRPGMAGLADVMIPQEPATNWGSDLLGFFKEAIPTYYQAQAQRDLIALNIKRAEQGQPPIDINTVSPQVNVGASHGVTTLGYVAVGGLVLYGLMSMFGKRRAS